MNTLNAGGGSKSASALSQTKNPIETRMFYFEEPPHDDGAWYEGNGVQHLADLIEPAAKRTCQMVEVETGEPADYRDTDEVIFHCTSCNAERGVFSYDVDGNVYTERPEYCPNCGAKVVW